MREDSFQFDSQFLRPFTENSGRWMSQDEQVPPFKEPRGEVGASRDEEQPTVGGGCLAGGLLQQTSPLDDSDVCERL